MYLLDSNTYIEAKNRYYGMDFCPAYWDWVDAQCATGAIGSIEMVYAELSDGRDELASWVKLRKGQFLAESDQTTQSLFVTVSDYVNNLNNKGADQKRKFLSRADPWLIAKAVDIGATVVTHEISVNDKSKNPQYCGTFWCSIY